MNISELLNEFLDNRVAQVNISLPASIISYDYKAQKATVQPLINLTYNDGQVLPMPQIHNVPVMHPRTATASITFPVSIGDTVSLLFSQRSLEEWLTGGGLVTPDDSRINNLTDAQAILGLYPFNNPSPAENNNDLLIQSNGNKIRLKPNGITEIECQDIIVNSQNATVNSADVEVNAQNIDLNTENLTINAVNTSCSGTLSADVFICNEAEIAGRDFITHQHIGVSTGSGTSGGVL